MLFCALGLYYFALSPSTLCRFKGFRVNVRLLIVVVVWVFFPVGFARLLPLSSSSCLRFLFVVVAVSLFCCLRSVVRLFLLIAVFSVVWCLLFVVVVFGFFGCVFFLVVVLLISCFSIVEFLSEGMWLLH